MFSSGLCLALTSSSRVLLTKATRGTEQDWTLHSRCSYALPCSLVGLRVTPNFQYLDLCAQWLSRNCTSTLPMHLEELRHPQIYPQPMTSQRWCINTQLCRGRITQRCVFYTSSTQHLIPIPVTGCEIFITHALQEEYTERESVFRNF